MSEEPDFEVQTCQAGVAVYTPTFPAPDKLIAMFLVETSGANSTMTVTPEHSHDGLNWLAKTALSLSGGGAYGSATTTAITGADAGTTPNLDRMRLKISCAAGTPNVRVYLHSRSY